MAVEQYYATGKRKNAVARVWIKSGSGQVKINGQAMPQYLGRKVLEMEVASPIKRVGLEGQIDVVAICHGGGLAGQAGAVRLGIAKAISDMAPDLRPPLRRDGYLTRDPRVKERKKYGRKRARRGFQFVKR